MFCWKSLINTEQDDIIFREITQNVLNIYEYKIKLKYHKPLTYFNYSFNTKILSILIKLIEISPFDTFLCVIVDKYKNIYTNFSNYIYYEELKGTIDRIIEKDKFIHLSNDEMKKYDKELYQYLNSLIIDKINLNTLDYLELFRINLLQLREVNHYQLVSFHSHDKINPAKCMTVSEFITNINSNFIFFKNQPNKIANSVGYTKMFIIYDLKNKYDVIKLHKQYRSKVKLIFNTGQCKVVSQVNLWTLLDYLMNNFKFLNYFDDILELNKYNINLYSKHKLNLYYRFLVPYYAYNTTNGIKNIREFFYEHFDNANDFIKWLKYITYFIKPHEKILNIQLDVNTNLRDCRDMYVQHSIIGLLKTLVGDVKKVYSEHCESERLTARIKFKHGITVNSRLIVIFGDNETLINKCILKIVGQIPNIVIFSNHFIDDDEFLNVKCIKLFDREFNTFNNVQILKFITNVKIH